MFLKRLFVAGAVALACAPAAVASASMTPAGMASPSSGPAFDWGGLYAGVYAGNLIGLGGTGVGIQAGVQVGYNFVRGGFLASIEAQGGILYAPPILTAEAGVSARIGAILRDRLLLYGVATRAIAAGTNLYYLGGGAELGLRNGFSVFVEATGVGIGGATCCDAVGIQAGVNFHR